MVRRQSSTAKDDTPPTMFRGIFAGMVELADSKDLGSFAERRVGSNPTTRTMGVGPSIFVWVGYEPLRR